MFQTIFGNSVFPILKTWSVIQKFFSFPAQKQTIYFMDLTDIKSGLIGSLSTIIVYFLFMCCQNSCIFLFVPVTHLLRCKVEVKISWRCVAFPHTCWIIGAILVIINRILYINRENIWWQIYLKTNWLFFLFFLIYRTCGRRNGGSPCSGRNSEERDSHKSWKGTQPCHVNCAKCDVSYYTLYFLFI